MKYNLRDPNRNEILSTFSRMSEIGIKSISVDKYQFAQWRMELMDLITGRDYLRDDFDNGKNIIAGVEINVLPD